MRRLINWARDFDWFLAGSLAAFLLAVTLASLALLFASLVPLALVLALVGVGLAFLARN